VDVDSGMSQPVFAQLENYPPHNPLRSLLLAFTALQLINGLCQTSTSGGVKASATAGLDNSVTRQT